MEAEHRFTRQDRAHASGRSLTATPGFHLYANAQTVGFLLFKMCRCLREYGVDTQWCLTP
ncbi:MAG TPA: hypothetical protein DCY47_17720 [Candidatus Accumulibacter sp.]|nr:hypothetical protein [Accumulibacter sp.]